MVGGGWWASPWSTTLCGRPPQAKDRGADAESRAVQLADEAETLGRRSDEAAARAATMRAALLRLRKEAEKAVEAQRQRAEAAKVPMEQAKALLEVARDKEHAAKAMRARAKQLGMLCCRAAGCVETCACSLV